MRLWDLYMLYGDQILICFAYTICKFHQSEANSAFEMQFKSPETLLKSDFEGIVDLLQNKLSNDFGCSDDEAIRLLHENMFELRRKRR